MNCSYECLLADQNSLRLLLPVIGKTFTNILFIFQHFAPESKRYNICSSLLEKLSFIMLIVAGCLKFP